MSDKWAIDRDLVARLHEIIITDAEFFQRIKQLPQAKPTNFSNHHSRGWCAVGLLKNSRSASPFRATVFSL